MIYGPGDLKHRVASVVVAVFIVLAGLLQPNLLVRLSAIALGLVIFIVATDINVKALVLSLANLIYEAIDRSAKS